MSKFDGFRIGTTAEIQNRFHIAYCTYVGKNNGNIKGQRGYFYFNDKGVRSKFVPQSNAGTIFSRARRFAEEFTSTEVGINLLCAALTNLTCYILSGNPKISLPAGLLAPLGYFYMCYKIDDKRTRINYGSPLI